MLEGVLSYLLFGLEAIMHYLHDTKIWNKMEIKSIQILKLNDIACNLIWIQI
jgi:hypothetical protein